MQVVIDILNAPELSNRYVVMRNIGGLFHYWGSYNDKERAIIVAREIDGVVAMKKDGRLSDDGEGISVAG